MPLIFQYGSNCDTDRLKSRLGDVRDLGRAQSVGKYELAFNKPSRKNNCAAADLLPAKGSGCHAWGVLYEVSDEAFTRLTDHVEGPSYKPIDIDVTNEAGEIVTAKTFVVKAERREQGLSTSADYVRHIVSGLREHHVPENYVQHIIDIAIRTNGQAEDRRAAERQAARLESLRHGDPPAAEMDTSETRRRGSC
jgi:hypothetical protein